MRMCMRKLLVLVMMFLLCALTLNGQEAQRSRVIILTDIEADPDDTESLVRLFLYSNVVDIKGLIATTSTHMRHEIHPQSIRRVIDAYAKVQPNLLRHEKGFPPASALLAVVKEGQPEYGMNAVGTGKDSEGSTWIVKTLMEEDARPLWVCVWGGANTLAQALFTIRQTMSEPAARALLAKLRVYTISDQDDSGSWIRKNYPELFYIVSPGGYDGATWSAINQVAPHLKNDVISNRWLAENIQQNHGPLGAVYPDVAYGMEGDTPSWLNLVPNGLSEPEHPSWGGWGGRYELYLPAYSTLDTGGFTGGVPIDPETRPIWTNALDRFTPSVPGEYGRAVHPDSVTFESNKATLWRWREDFQNDFAARMDWCVQSPQAANHPPVPILSHPAEITVKSGKPFFLDASRSSDPDGDNLGFEWFQYPEAGSYKNLIPIGWARNLARLALTAPQVEKSETTHFIAKVTDKGSPPLTRYARVIVTIAP
jgi:hypothetical protein